jgi:hypothetical protein
MLRAAPVIGTMRVRTRRADSAALRLAIERQLPSDAFQARGIGPSAILLIRRMADPLPQRLQSDANAAPASEDWTRALQGRIDSLCSAATRPDRGRIAPGAEAILLADEAELLACLAIELALGAPPTWWRLAIARYLNCSRLPALCRAHLPLLPAIFALLVRWERLDDVVQALSAEEALELCALFAAANDLHAVANVVLRYHAESAVSEEGVARDAEPAAPAGDAQHASPDIADGSSTAEPCARRASLRIDSWIPATSRSRSVSHRLLIALLLGFREQPAALGAPRFAAELRVWLRGASSTARAAESHAETMRAAAMPPLSSAPLSGATQSPQRAPQPTHPETLAPSVDAVSSDTADERIAPDTPVAESTSTVRDPLAGLDGIVTELGGVFCLVNVLEHLDLPDCFEGQCGLASGVGAFGTLEAIARVFAGALDEELRHDPVWAALATLDGREPNSPPRATGLRPPGTQLPAEWQDADADFPLTLDESHAHAIEALRRDGWPAPLLEWLALTIPYISWRIAHACGLPEIGQVARMLLELPARVYVTEAHIDVVASIENIRIPIRLAGLDRSPGWVRSLQRIVLIHFE